MKWFCFVAFISGRWLYVGKCLETEANVRAAFPRAWIEGNTVHILPEGRR